MNRREFEQTAPKLRERIVGMVSRIIGDEKANQAEDVAQDTLLRLWTMREKLDSYRSVEALAMVIARNLALDSIRKEGVTTIPLDHVAETHDTRYSPDDLISETEAEAKMDSIMKSLPSGQRAILRMRHEEGMEISEIASLTGSTEGAVRVSLSRARKHVLQLFKNNQNE